MQCPPTPGPRLVFDLGKDVALSEISLWGYDNGNSNGARVFSLRFATEADGTGGFGTSITLNPSFAMILDVTPRQSFRYTQVVARYVELTPTDNLRGVVGVPGGTFFVFVEGDGGNSSFNHNEKDKTDADPTTPKSHARDQRHRRPVTDSFDCRLPHRLYQRLSAPARPGVQLR